MAEIYDLDAVYAEVAGEPFEFRWAGQQWRLPHFGDIDWRAAGMAADFEKAVGDDGAAELDVTVLQQLFVYAFGSEQAERWDKVPQNLTAMVKLFEQWQERSRVGESSASDGSSASTGRPSKRTSTATTASGSPGRSTGRRKSG